MGARPHDLPGHRRPQHFARHLHFGAIRQSLPRHGDCQQPPRHPDALRPAGPLLCRHHRLRGLPHLDLSGRHNPHPHPPRPRHCQHQQRGRKPCRQSVVFHDRNSRLHRPAGGRLVLPDTLHLPRPVRDHHHGGQRQRHLQLTQPLLRLRPAPLPRADSLHPFHRRETARTQHPLHEPDTILLHTGRLHHLTIQLFPRTHTYCTRGIYLHVGTQQQSRQRPEQFAHLCAARPPGVFLPPVLLRDARHVMLHRHPQYQTHHLQRIDRQAGADTRRHHRGRHRLPRPIPAPEGFQQHPLHPGG